MFPVLFFNNLDENCVKDFPLDNLLLTILLKQNIIKFVVIKIRQSNFG